jgi:hypothetical protein
MRCRHYHFLCGLGENIYRRKEKKILTRAPVPLNKELVTLAAGQLIYKDTYYEEDRKKTVCLNINHVFN